MIHTNLESLDAQAKEKIQLFLDKLKENDIKYVVIETKRDADVQRAYYAQGRRPLKDVNELRKAAGNGFVSFFKELGKVLLKAVVIFVLIVAIAAVFPQLTTILSTLIK